MNAQHKWISGIILVGRYSAASKLFSLQKTQNNEGLPVMTIQMCNLAIYSIHQPLLETFKRLSHCKLG